MTSRRQKVWFWHMLWHGNLNQLDPVYQWQRQNPVPSQAEDFHAWVQWQRDYLDVHRASFDEWARQQRFEYSFNSFTQLLATSLGTAAAIAATIGFVTTWWAGVLSFPLAVAGLVYLWFGWWRSHEKVTRNASDPWAAKEAMRHFKDRAESLAGVIVLSLPVSAVVGFVTSWWAGVLSFPVVAVALKTIEWRGLGWLRKGS